MVTLKGSSWREFSAGVWNNQSRIRSASPLPPTCPHQTITPPPRGCQIGLGELQSMGRGRGLTCEWVPQTMEGKMPRHPVGRDPANPVKAFLGFLEAPASPYPRFAWRQAREQGHPVAQKPSGGRVAWRVVPLCCLRCTSFTRQQAQEHRQRVHRRFCHFAQPADTASLCCFYQGKQGFQGPPASLYVPQAHLRCGLKGPVAC